MTVEICADGTAVVVGGRPLGGRIRVPGDKSISHRALIFAALGEGTSTISGLSRGGDVASTATALGAMGAEMDLVVSPDRRSLEGRIVGGRSRLGEAPSALDCGNSGTSMRLLAGLAASLDGLFILQGDPSLSARPMARVLGPLAQMGARVDACGRGSHAPLVVRGGGLGGIEYSLPVPSAQLKAAVLIAGLGASGRTVVHEPEITRAHTEEMLPLAGVEVGIEAEGEGRAISVSASPLSPFTIDVPGDPSQAAFWVVAACCVPGSDLVVENVYVGQGRAGFLTVLGRMGAEIEITPRGDNVADIRARYGNLVPTDVSGGEVASLVDEVPVLAVAMACANGASSISGAGELRVKESDRIATTTAMLAAMGIEAQDRPDGFRVTGGRLRAGHVSSHADHRIAMAGAVAALIGGGRTVIEGWDAVATSYPGFAADMAHLETGEGADGG